MACFMVVGREEPLYELLLEPTLSRREDVARATQFILHGSLDLVDLQVWTNPSTCVSRRARAPEQATELFGLVISLTHLFPDRRYFKLVDRHNVRRLTWGTR